MSVKQCLEVIISTNLPHILMNVHRKQLQFDKFEQEFKVGPQVMFSDLEMTQVRLVWSVQVCKVGAQVMFSDLEMTQVRLVRFVQECDLLFATDWPKLGSKDSNPFWKNQYLIVMKSSSRKCINQLGNILYKQSSCALSLILLQPLEAATPWVFGR